MALAQLFAATCMNTLVQHMRASVHNSACLSTANVCFVDTQYKSACMQGSALQPLVGIHSLQHLSLAQSSFDDPSALQPLFVASGSSVQGRGGRSSEDSVRRSAGHSAAALRASCPGFAPSTFLEHAGSGPTAGTIDPTDVSAASSDELNTSLARSLSASCAVSDTAAAFAHAMLEPLEATTHYGPAGLLSLDLTAVDAADGQVLEAAVHMHPHLVALRVTASQSVLATLPAVLQALPRLQHLGLAYDWHACACTCSTSAAAISDLSSSSPGAHTSAGNLAAAGPAPAGLRCQERVPSDAAMRTREPSEQLARVWQALVATAALRATNTTVRGKSFTAAVEADVAAVSEHAAWWRQQPSKPSVCTCAEPVVNVHGISRRSAGNCLPRNEAQSRIVRVNPPTHVPGTCRREDNCPCATASRCATLVPAAPFHLALDLELLVPSLWLAGALPRGLQSGALTLAYGGRTSAALRAAPITVRGRAPVVWRSCHAAIVWNRIGVAMSTLSIVMQMHLHSIVDAL